MCIHLLSHQMFIDKYLQLYERSIQLLSHQIFVGRHWYLHRICTHWCLLINIGIYMKCAYTYWATRYSLANIGIYMRCTSLLYHGICVAVGWSFLNEDNRECNVSVFWYQVYQVRLCERLLTWRGLLSDSTCVLKAEPGKLDIKRHEPGILFISLHAYSLFKLAIIRLLSIFMSVQRHWWRHSKSAASWWPVKGTCREIDNVYQTNV